MYDIGGLLKVVKTTAAVLTKYRPPLKLFDQKKKKEKHLTIIFR